MLKALSKFRYYWLVTLIVFGLFRTEKAAQAIGLNGMLYHLNNALAGGVDDLRTEHLVRAAQWQDQTISVSEESRELNYFGSLLYLLGEGETSGIGTNENVLWLEEMWTRWGEEAARSDEFALVESLPERAAHLSLNNFGEYWSVVGTMYTRQSMWDEAVRSYEKSVQYRPNNGNAWIALGQAYAASEQPDRAINAFENALSSLPEDAIGISNVHYQLGLIYQYHPTNPDVDAAEEAYRKAITRDSYYTDIDIMFTFFQRGALYSMIGRWEAAIEYYQVTLQYDSYHYPTLTHLGRAYWKNGNISDAIRTLEQAIVVAPEEIEAYLTLGDIYRSEDSPALARAAYEEALKIEPDNDQARQGLTRLP